MEELVSTNLSNLTRGDYSWYSAYAHPTFYALVMSVGVVGNVLSIVVIAIIVRHKTSSRCTPDLLLGWLALVDLLSIWGIHLLGLLAYLLPAWPMPSYLCRLQAIFIGVYFTLEFFIQVSISVDRYLALVRPLQYYKRRITGRTVHVVIASVALFSIATSCFRVLVPSGDTLMLITWRLCVGQWDVTFIPHVLFLSLGASIFTVGFVICLVCNSSLVKILWRYSNTKSDYLLRQISDAMKVVKNASSIPAFDGRCPSNGLGPRLPPKVPATGSPSSTSPDIPRSKDISQKWPSKPHANYRLHTTASIKSERSSKHFTSNIACVSQPCMDDMHGGKDDEPPQVDPHRNSRSNSIPKGQINTSFNGTASEQTPQTGTLLMRSRMDSCVAIYLHEPPPIHTPESPRGNGNKTVNDNTSSFKEVKSPCPGDEQFGSSGLRFQVKENGTSGSMSNAEIPLLRDDNCMAITPNEKLTQFQRHVQKSLRMVQRNFQRQRQEILLARLVIISTTVFVATWTLFIVVLVSEWTHSTISEVFEDLALKMIFANAFLNPVFYGLCQGRFRKGYLYVTQFLCSTLTCGILQRPGDDRVFYESRKKKVDRQIEAAKLSRRMTEERKQKQQSRAHARQILEQTLLVHRASVSNCLQEFQPSMALQDLFERYNTMDDDDDDEYSESSVDYDALAFMDLTVKDIYVNIQRIWSLYSMNELREKDEDCSDIELDVDYDEIIRRGSLDDVFSEKHRSSEYLANAPKTTLPHQSI